MRIDSFVSSGTSQFGDGHGIFEMVARHLRSSTSSSTPTNIAEHANAHLVNLDRPMLQVEQSAKSGLEAEHPRHLQAGIVAQALVEDVTVVGRRIIVETGRLQYGPL